MLLDRNDLETSESEPQTFKRSEVDILGLEGGTPVSASLVHEAPHSTAIQYNFDRRSIRKGSHEHMCMLSIQRDLILSKYRGPSAETEIGQAAFRYTHVKGL